MKYLLDTHALLWFFGDVENLPQTSFNAIMDPLNEIYVSIVSAWELAIKISIGKLEGYGLAPYSEVKIDLGVLSALCKLPAPNLDNVVRTLLVEMARGTSPIYESIAKFGSLDALWDLVRKFYGYNFPEQSLDKLAILLLCSHLSHCINALPNEWRDYASDNSNCYVFVDNFMKNSQLWYDYNILANFAADKLGLACRADKWTIDEIADCDTFEDFDRSIISRITGNITQNAGEYEHYRKIINSRKNRRYYHQFETEYEALLYACEYFELEAQYKDLLGASTLSLFQNYVKNYYKLDSSYRHFISAFDRLDENSEYASLMEMVENSYTYWYLNELSMKWCGLWDDEAAWRLPGVTPQQDFYNQYAYRFISDNERLIVIISDGLRYESAVELNAILNREQKGASELDVMLGVIPSFTSLGMASLMPRKQFAITDKAEFVIQGISTEGTENKLRILQLVKKESIAIQYDDLITWKKQQLSEKFSGMKLIYIYPMR